MRAKMGEAFGGKGIPPGTTIGQAIEAQKKLVAEQKQKEAEAAALKAKLQKEIAEARRVIDEAVVVTVIKLWRSRKDFDAGRFSDAQAIKLGFQNKTTKGIAGVSGKMVFTDMFDKKISDVHFSFDDGIKAGGTATWTGSRRINQFDSEDRALANIAEGKYTAKFEPEMIVFVDGTKLRVPAGD